MGDADVPHVVWKYLLDHTKSVIVEGWHLHPLFAAWDPNAPGYSDLPLPSVWVERAVREPEHGALIQRLEFVFVGTGHEFDMEWTYIDSAICGPFVWHVYCRPID